MIVYFSSTGNCRYVALQLAKETNDKAVSIENANVITVEKGEKLGFVFPTYFWRLPWIIDEYMKNVQIESEEKNPYIYFISTFGTTCGQSGAYVKKFLKKKGFNLSASFSIKTVDDWTVWFDLSNPKVVEKILKEEKSQLEEIIPMVKEKVTGDKMKNKMPRFLICGSTLMYHFYRKTKNLQVEDTCIGCGKCEKECPMSAIKVEDGKPIWVKDRCTMCLHCVHTCPKIAISYNKKTKKHGQYMHP